MSEQQQQADDYFEKLADFAQKQQEKVNKMLEDNAKNMAEFKPFEVTDDMNDQVDKLLQNVNDELEKAMGKVSEQMKKLSEQANKINSAE